MLLGMLLSCLVLSGCEVIEDCIPLPESVRDWTLNDTEEITDDLGDWFDNLFFYFDLWFDL